MTFPKKIIMAAIYQNEHELSLLMNTFSYRMTRDWTYQMTLHVYKQKPSCCKKCILSKP